MLSTSLLDAIDAHLKIEDVEPAVPIEQSLKGDELTCLECGRTMRSLKSHLRTSHHMSPADYRFKWGLPGTYPMMAPAASELRSQTSKNTMEKVMADPTVWKGGKRKRHAE